MRGPLRLRPLTSEEERVISKLAPSGGSALSSRDSLV